MIKKFYALYNHDEEICFVGTAKECCDFIGCSYKRFFQSKSRGCYIKAKYRAYYVFDEDVTPQFKKCKNCGKVKPISEFYFIKSRNGYSTKCKLCKIKENRKYGKSRT